MAVENERRISWGRDAMALPNCAYARETTRGMRGCDDLLYNIYSRSSGLKKMYNSLCLQKKEHIMCTLTGVYSLLSPLSIKHAKAAGVYPIV